MDLGLKNKVALVMGSSAGLGKGVARTLIQEGALVCLCSRNEEKLALTQKEIKADSSFVCDLSQPNSAQQLVQKVLKKYGRLDILVVNTGGPPKAQFHEVSSQMWKESFDSLWMAAVEAIQEALPSMKNHKFGRILLVTSVAAKEALPSLTISNGLRAGLLGLARSLSHEVAQYGVTINSILPGYTETERLSALGLNLNKIAEQIPAGRLGTTEEFGALAAFLVSESAGYITGQAIAIDGGSMHGI